MKFLFLTLVGLGFGQYPQRTYENPAASIYSSNEVHQGNLCGDVTHYVLQAQPQVLKSPYYPHSFSPQTQCMWTVRIADPAARIKFSFDDWAMPTSGDGCMAMYFQIMDGAGIDDDTGVSGATASVKLCGKNPGFIVTHTNTATVQLHADEAGASAMQRFRIILTKTYERPRMLDFDGHAVTDGRPKGAVTPVRPVAPVRPKPFGPKPMGPAPVGAGMGGPGMGGPGMGGPGMGGPVGPRGGGPVARPGMGGSNSATFHGASYGFTNRAPGPNQMSANYGQMGHSADSGRQNDDEYVEDVEMEKKGISKVALAFIYIAVILSLIVLAIFVRKRTQAKADSNKDQSTKPQDVQQSKN